MVDRRGEVYPSTRLSRLSLPEDTLLASLQTCWPVGASWASYIAQRVMTGGVVEAGIPRNAVPSRGDWLPPAGEPCGSVATDDVVLFESGTAEQLSEGSVSY